MFETSTNHITKNWTNQIAGYKKKQPITAMGLDKKLSQLMDCPLPTNNTHIIMSTKIAHTQI